ncbi:uncharacterized protein LOC108680721 [Hyalella azteca]|uniref:Uncharacterized protein LOC108680721 n=1 Tax=Hyalella azteca TaxID=294128 RepID=A0A8B7PG24_HYAAZ|nr:uncharacterized protein LOC108680721 [Hyalella azteca]
MCESKRKSQFDVTSSQLFFMAFGIFMAVIYSNYREVQVPAEEIRRRREAYGYGAVADTAPTTPPKLGCHPGVNDPQLRSLPHLYTDVAPDPSAQNIYQIEVSMNMKITHKILCSIESMCSINSDAHVWFLLTRATLDASSAQRLLSLQKICPRLCVAHVNVRTVMRNTSFHAILNSEGLWDDMARFPSNSLFHFERNHPTPKKFLTLLSDTFSPVLSRLLYGMLGPLALIKFFRYDECAVRILTPQNAPARHPAPSDLIGPRLSAKKDSSINGETVHEEHRTPEKFSYNLSSANKHDDDEDDSFDCIHDIFGTFAHQPVYVMHCHAMFYRNKTLVGPDDNILPGAFTVELYNSHTKAIPVEEGSLVDIIAQKTCPLTHSKCPSLMCN